MSKNSIQVILADGRRMLREGLCAILEQRPGFKVVGQADEASAAVKLLSAVDADVVVLIVTPRTRELSEVMRALHQTKRDARVVLILHLNASPDAVQITELQRAGALGCLAKECTADELCTAIAHVMQRKTFLSPQLAEAVSSNNGSASRDRLAPREREVLRRIANGESTNHIAGALHIATKTVDTHRRRIMTKTRHRTLAGLTKYAIREGLSSLET
jgi:two-component system response regulator NreC